MEVNNNMVVKRWVMEYLKKNEGTIRHVTKPDHLCFLLLLPCILLYAYGFGVIFLHLTIIFWGAICAYDIIEIKNQDAIDRIYELINDEWKLIKEKFTPYRIGWIIDIVGAVVIFFIICVILSQFM